MTDTKLEPELPQATFFITGEIGKPMIPAYTAEQVRAAIEADRNKRAPVGSLTDEQLDDLVIKHGWVYCDDVCRYHFSADDLRALLSSVAPRVPKWVSVDERLPTHIYSVLGYVTEGPLTVGGTSPMRDIVSYCPDRDVWLQHVDGDDAVVSVSHWQDLPAAPQPTQEG